MAATSRVPPSGAPTSTTAAVPVYSRTPGPTGLYTGTIAIPRNTPRDSSGAPILTPEQQAGATAAVERAAVQRVQRTGLPSDAAPVLVDYFNRTGRFPDLAGLASVASGAGNGGGFGGGAGTSPLTGAASPLAGLFSNPTTLLAIGAAVVGLIVLTRKGGK